MEDHTRLVALVTGSNTGIGLEVVRGICGHGIITVLTARNVEKGKQALQLLQEQGVKNVEFHQLDVNDIESVDALAKWIQEKFGRLDILVNNAGIYNSSLNRVENAEAIIQTNYRAVKAMNKAMLPLMRHGGARIITISSSASRLDMLEGEVWRSKLLDVENLDEQVVDSFVDDFLSHLEKEWVPHEIQNIDAYCVSKMALSAYSRVFAKQETGIQVYCMCPGHTNTALSLNTGHPASVGADTGVWLATTSAQDISSGHFYVNRTDVGFLQIPLFSNGILYPNRPEYLEYVRNNF